MVGDLGSEVEAVNVTQVEALRQLVVRNIIRSRVVLGPLRNLLKGGLELGVILDAELLALLLDVYISLSQLDRIGLAVIAVLWVVLLQHADVGRPAEVVCINEGDGLIILLAWYMFGVSINPLARASDALECLDLRRHLQVDLGLSLKRDIVCRLCNLILVRDDSNFDVLCISFDRYSFFHIVVSLLLAKEALNLMLLHRE